MRISDWSSDVCSSDLARAAASASRLANEPELVELLAKEPGKCDNFAEEILRHESPVQGLFRMTTADVEVAGVTIPKGSLVNLRYGSANRDERKYECPEVLRWEERRVGKGCVSAG